MNKFFGISKKEIRSLFLDTPENKKSSFLKELMDFSKKYISDHDVYSYVKNFDDGISFEKAKKEILKSQEEAKQFLESLPPQEIPKKEIIVRRKQSLVELAKKIEKVAYELNVFGVQKEAAQPRLYEYEYEGMKFYMEEKKPQGVRLPAGKALFTKKFYPVSGALAKDLKD